MGQTVSVLYLGEDDVVTLSRTLVLVALGEYLENNSHFHFGLDSGLTRGGQG